VAAGLQRAVEGLRAGGRRRAQGCSTSVGPGKGGYQAASSESGLVKWAWEGLLLQVCGSGIAGPCRPDLTLMLCMGV
jgi:hypothetical protein